MNVLPSDIYTVILSQLDVVSKAMLRKTCTYCRDIINEPLKVSTSIVVTHGSLKQLLWYYDNYYFISYKIAATVAARTGNLEVLEWVNKEPTNNRNPVNFKNIHEVAMNNVQLHVLQWFEKVHGIPINTNAVANNAIDKNKIEVLKLLKQDDYKFNVDHLLRAGINKNAEIATWLKENGVPN